MTKDDVLFGYRQQLFAEAARTSGLGGVPDVRGAPLDLLRLEAPGRPHGLEMLRPRERRRPQMPNQLPKMVEERIVSFSIAHPGLGPQAGVARELARARSGAGSSSRPTGSGRCSAATGSTRAPSAWG